MSTTISKGRMFRVSIAVDDERLDAMKKAPELAGQAVQAGAEYWHSGTIPKHFARGAFQKYGYAERNINYLKDPRKAGKPALVFSGSLRGDIIRQAAFKQLGKGSVETKMWARVLNLVPNMPQNSEDYFVRQSSGKSYPNMKREIKILLLDEHEAIAAVVVKQLEEVFDPGGLKAAANTYYGA